MAIFNQATTWEFYSASCLGPLSEWNLLSQAEFVDGALKIYPGGYAGVKLFGTLGHGLNQSKFRYLTITATIPSLGNSYNYTNHVDAVLKGSYSLNGNLFSYYHTTALTKMNSTIGEDGSVSMSRCLTMTDVSFSALEFYIKNHTDETISVSMCSLLVSIDVSKSQIVGSINQSAGLQSVTAYADGFSVLYAGQENPLKIWWVDDGNGGLGGLNVNNERFVAFYDKTSELLT